MVLVRRGRRKNSDWHDVLYSTALDGAQQHLGVCRAADDQRRHRIRTLDAVLGSRKSEQPIGDPWTAQEKHLQEPIERDRDLAEEEGAKERRIQKHVIEYEQRNGEDRDRAENIAQIRQRSETPLRHVEVEVPIDHAGIGKVARQYNQEPSIALVQSAILPIRKTKIQSR